MYKAILYSLTTIIFIVVMVLVSMFLIDINKVEEFSTPLEMQNSIESNKTTEKSWVDRITGKMNDYYYPVTEININLNLDYSVDSKYRSRARHYKLMTEKLNPYHFFCLKQVLDQSRVKHRLERYDNEIGVVLYSNDPTVLTYVVNELKKYGIQSHIEEEIRN